jgi:hypothetical protein
VRQDAFVYARKLERVGDGAVTRPGTPLFGVAALEFSSTLMNDPFEVGIQPVASTAAPPYYRAALRF